MKIAQDEKYHGDDWWSWSVWIDGTADELRGIEHVTYTLHSSFANPVRRVTDRKSKFRLDESGWGGFPIYATVMMTNGKSRSLQRELELYYPPEHEADATVIRIGEAGRDRTGEAGRGTSEAAPESSLETALAHLHQAIATAAPDAKIETDPSGLKVMLTKPSLFSISKGVQGWLSSNPSATLSFENAQKTVSDVTLSQVPDALSSLIVTPNEESTAVEPAREKRPASRKAASKAKSPKKAASRAATTKKAAGTRKAASAKKAPSRGRKKRK